MNIPPEVSENFNELIEFYDITQEQHDMTFLILDFLYSIPEKYWICSRNINVYIDKDCDYIFLDHDDEFIKIEIDYDHLDINILKDCILVNEYHIDHGQSGSFYIQGVELPPNWYDRYGGNIHNGYSGYFIIKHEYKFPLSNETLEEIKRKILFIVARRFMSELI